MLMIRKITAGACIAVVSVSAVAQDGFDFDDIPGVNDEPVVSINLTPVTLGFLREMTRAVDPATADLLQDLRSIQLRVYHGSNNARQFSNFIEDVTEELEDRGWQSVMSANNEGMSARIHMRMTADAVSGMTVMMFDGAEAVFINIDGTISAADLGRIMAAVHAGDVLGQLPPIPGVAPPPVPQARPAPDNN